MKFCFDQLDRRRCCVPLEGKRVFLEEEGVDVELTGRLCFSRKKDGGDVFLQGELAGSFIGRCSFCADDVPFSFDETFTYRFVVGREDTAFEDELECSAEQAEVLFVTAPEVELDEILREQVCLNLPMQITCRHNCKGVCSGCGANLNSEQCCCGEDVSSSPFAVLSKLKK